MRETDGIGGDCESHVAADCGLVLSGFIRESLIALCVYACRICVRIIRQEGELHQNITRFNAHGGEKRKCHIASKITDEEPFSILMILLRRKALSNNDNKESTKEIDRESGTLFNLI